MRAMALDIARSMGLFCQKCILVIVTITIIVLQTVAKFFRAMLRPFLPQFTANGAGGQLAATLDTRTSIRAGFP
jgi:hypothetical protein